MMGDILKDTHALPICNFNPKPPEIQKLESLVFSKGVLFFKFYLNGVTGRVSEPEPAGPCIDLKDYPTLPFTPLDPSRGTIKFNSSSPFSEIFLGHRFFKLHF